MLKHKQLVLTPCLTSVPPVWVLPAHPTDLVFAGRKGITFTWRYNYSSASKPIFNFQASPSLHLGSFMEQSPSSPDAFCFSLARLFQPQTPVWTARTAARAAPAFPSIVLVPPATSTRCLLHQLLPGVRLCPVPPPVPILLPAVGRDGQAYNRVVCIPQSRRNGDISQRAGRGELFKGQLCCSGGGGERQFLPNPLFWRSLLIPCFFFLTGACRIWGGKNHFCGSPSVDLRESQFKCYIRGQT